MIAQPQRKLLNKHCKREVALVELCLRLSQSLLDDGLMLRHTGLLVMLYQQEYCF